MPQDVNPLLDRLIEAFPACFSRSVPQPLKIGLGEELLAWAGVHPALADLSHTQIRRALKVYTGSPAYRKALTRGGPRYDLDGQPAGEVTPKQQRDASTPRKTPPAPAPPAAPAVDLKARLQEVIALAIAGQRDEAIDGGFRPVKPAAATPAPKAPAPKAPAPPGSPAMGDATPSLKRRTLSRGIARPLTRWKRQGCARARFECAGLTRAVSHATASGIGVRGRVVIYCSLTEEPHYESIVLRYRTPVFRQSTL